MNIRPILLGCGLMLAAAAVADDQQDFEVAYKAYRDAVAAQQFHLALEPAAEARRVGESLYADDPKRTATLVFNHGFVLGKANRHDEAYRTLKQARKLMREAFGEGAKEMLNVEMALLGSAPSNAVRRCMQEALKLVAMHHPGNSKLIGDVKLQAGLRLWGKQSVPLFQQAAEAYDAAGDERGYALGQFWIGKRHFVNRDYRRVPRYLNAAIEALPEGHHLALMAHAHLVEVHEELGQSNRATKHCLAIGRTKPWTGNDDYLPLFKRPPEYPRSALTRNLDGFVLLEFTVDEMGFVRKPEVVDSKGGKVFHEPALEAAKGFRYAPRFVDGKAVPVTEVRNRIVFMMRPPG